MHCQLTHCHISQFSIQWPLEACHGLGSSMVATVPNTLAHMRHDSISILEIVGSIACRIVKHVHRHGPEGEAWGMRSIEGSHRNINVTVVLWASEFVRQTSFQADVALHVSWNIRVHIYTVTIKSPIFIKPPLFPTILSQLDVLIPLMIDTCQWT